MHALRRRARAPAQGVAGGWRTPPLPELAGLDRARGGSAFGHRRGAVRACAEALTPAHMHCANAALASGFAKPHRFAQSILQPPGSGREGFDALEFQDRA